MTDRMYRVVSGDDETLEICETEEKAIDARVRWMDSYPEAIVEVYERVE